jgi:hypothetical protein
MHPGDSQGAAAPCTPAFGVIGNKVFFLIFWEFLLSGNFHIKLLFWEFSFSGNHLFWPVINFYIAFWEYSILGIFNSGNLQFWESSILGIFILPIFLLRVFIAPKNHWINCQDPAIRKYSNHLN